MRPPITRRCHARIGLLGNPSDGYGGKVIALSLANFWAEVTLRESETIRFERHPVHDNDQYTSLAQLKETLDKHGFGGGVQLLQATCKRFFEHCSAHGISLGAQGAAGHPGASSKQQLPNFTLSYDTSIPRQSGLAGSSAIICAALSCLMEFYGVGHLIPKEDRPSLVLSVEQELGITAGLQDRVIQVYGGLVYMDFGPLAQTGRGVYEPLDPGLLPPLHLMWSDSPSHSGKVHNNVRQRWQAGDPDVVGGMQEVAELAAQGRAALEGGTPAALAPLMDQNFQLRRRMFGDAVLGPSNLRMVQVAQSVGASAKLTGSGGAVVVMCPQGPEQEQRLQEAASQAGFHIARVQVAPATAG